MAHDMPYLLQVAQVHAFMLVLSSNAFCPHVFVSK